MRFQCEECLATEYIEVVGSGEDEKENSLTINVQSADILIEFMILKNSSLCK